MQMKKLGLLLCSVILCLQGCVIKNKTVKNTTKLRVAIFDGAYDSSYWEEIGKRFERAHPGVDVEFDVNENIGNILLPRMAGNTLPDVVYLGLTNASGFTQAMIKEEKIASLADVFTPELSEQFMENVLDDFAIRPYEDQEVYLAPLYFNVTGLWYNQSLFDQYGYQVPKTWDEFFELGDQAKADGIDLFIYQGMNPTYLEALLWPMLVEKVGLANVDNIFQNKKNAWSQEGVYEVLSTIKKLQSYMQPDTISLTYMEAQRRFMEGKALFIPCGNWLEAEMQSLITKEDELLFMSVPSFETDAKRYATIMLEQIYVVKNAKQAELGKAFVAYQFEAESVVLNQQMSKGFVPIIQESKGIKEQPFQIFNDGITPISANFSPLLEMDMNREVFEQIANIIAGTSSVEEAIAYLNTFTHE